MDKKIETEMDGIRVRKSVEANDQSTVIIAFRISSERDEPAAVEFRDPIPAEHEVQVQPGNDGEWTVAEETATYDCVLRSGETATTGYKSTTFEDQALDSYSTAPSLEVTAPTADVVPKEPSTEETETFTRGASDAVFSFHGPGCDSRERPTPVENTEEEKPASNPPASDPAEPEEADDASNDSDAPPEQEEAGTAPDEFDAPGDEMAVADLVTDLSASTGPEADQTQDTKTQSSEAEEEKASSDDVPSSTERSPEAVGDDIASPDEVQARIERVDEPVRTERLDRASPSLEIRVQYLQSRFHDLAAYLDAMEEFIDEHGDGEHVLTALSSDMERVQKRLDKLDGQQSELQTHLEAIDDRVEILDERAETIDDDVCALADSLDRMEAVQQAVKEDVKSLKVFQEKLQSAI